MYRSLNRRRLLRLRRASMKLRYISSFAVLLAGVCGSLLAQDSATSKSYTYSTANRVKQTAEEAQDIGEFKEEQEGFKSLRDKSRFNVNIRSGYTTKARLEGNHSSSDFLFLPTLEAGFHTPLGEHFSFDLATKVESVTYAK